MRPQTPLQILLAAYAKALPARPELRARLASWPSLRAQARRRWASLVEARRFGQDVSERALAQLLPQGNGPAAQARDAFVHPAAGCDDPVARLVSGGWLHPGEEPILGRALADFVQQCTDDPAALWQACDALAAAPGGRGLGGALLSPILHALRPDSFALVTPAVTALLGRIAGRAHGAGLGDYPAATLTARRLLAADDFALHAAGHLPTDLLDGIAEWCAGAGALDGRLAAT